jgi:hypothetical protein
MPRKYWFKVIQLLPVTLVSDEDAQRMAEQQQADMREHLAERERHQRRQAIIDVLKIIR